MTIKDDIEQIKIVEKRLVKEVNDKVENRLKEIDQEQQELYDFLKPFLEQIGEIKEIRIKKKGHQHVTTIKPGNKLYGRTFFE